jgi:hypothetical protein
MSDMYLMGDEDSGVGLYCLDCWDGGRPLAYYDRYGNPYADDAAVAAVSTLPALVTAAQDHVRRAHGGAADV